MDVLKFFHFDIEETVQSLEGAKPHTVFLIAV